MSGVIRVLLPPTSAHLSSLVLAAGGVPVVDATGDAVPEVPEGAWVRTRPGRPAPGTGPVVLAELGAPVPDRETWLETGVPREVPGGFAGLVLKGREAGGLCGEDDGLVALAACPDPSRVVLDAGCGPRTAAAAAALGAAGVLLVEQHLGCPEIALPPALERRLHLPDDEVTRLVQGVRVCASATAPVLRRLIQGVDDPWSLAASVWHTGDPSASLWLMGQGLALARTLAERHGTLTGLIAAYLAAIEGRDRAARSARVGSGRPVHTASGLVLDATCAGTGGSVGSAVLWEEASWLGRPVAGGPLAAMAAVGGEVVASAEQLEAHQRSLPVPDPIVAPTAPAAAADPVPAAGEADEGVVLGVATGSPAIAIIGIGCWFPGGSSSPEAFWANIVGRRDAIGPVPSERWDASLFWDVDPSAPDKTYSKIGGFVTDFKFDPKPFRIPPNVARQVDTVQQMTLVCVAQALKDAGLRLDRKGEGRDFDRERCTVILGNSLGGEMTDKYAIRLAWPDVARKLLATPPFCDLADGERARWLADMEKAYKAGLPIVDEDSMPGELANVIAGRIANAFDLGGANFTVDAACASSMAALQTAVKSLQDQESDLAITGGADRSMNVATYVKFSKIGALSPDHSSPFDASANGFVMGEGCGILVLKRYEEAVRDGDKVYAVLRGVGAASDGKGKGITAPNLAGQVRALKRAYEGAGFGPETVDLVEAHGTSTLVGDKVEVEALNAVIGGSRGARGPIRIGSVKSMIGHLKSAAGAASVIKVALALHHGVFPPSLHFRQARTDVPLDVIPLRVQTEAEPWPLPPEGVRRAGVSAFGFGGTNFHVVLESYVGRTLAESPVRHATPDQAAPVAAPVAVAAPVVAAAVPVPLPVIVAGPSSSDPVPDGLWATSGRNEAELLENLEALAAGRSAPFYASAPLRIAAAPADPGERDDQLKRAIGGLRKGSNPDLLRARGIAYEDVPFDRKLVFLFTGQGSQYVDMGRDLAEVFPVVRDTFAEADRILTPALGRPITRLINAETGDDADAMDEVLRRTEYSQPATLTVDVALLRLLVAYGAVPDMVAGHSLGEYGAAVAAGVMSFDQSLRAVSARGKEMASIRLDDPGKMAGIATSSKVVDEVLADVDGYVIAANKNCPTQTVIAGASDAVDEACERFKARGITVYLLPVSHAFHSAIVAPASNPLRGVLANLGLETPKRPITTNVTGEYYPTGPGAIERIIDLLAQQISAPVEWTAQMERMYEDDGRVFVEVGPKRALSGFTVAILKRRPHRAIYTNHPKRGGLASFRDALAQLLTLGVPLRAQPLPTASVDLFARSEPRRATTEAITAFRDAPTVVAPVVPAAPAEAAADLREGILRIVARSTGYDVAELDVDFELEADLGIDTVKQAEVFSVVRDTYGIPADADFRFSDHKTLRSLVDWAASRTGARRVGVDESSPKPSPVAPVRAVPAPAAPLVPTEVVTGFLTQAAAAGLSGLDAAAFASALLPAVQSLLAAAWQAARDHQTPAPPAPVAARAPTPVPAQREVAPALVPPDARVLPEARLPGSRWKADPRRRIVASGASIGLPGGEQVFADGNFDAMLDGQNRISAIGARADKFLELGLVRLVKDPQTGQGSFLPVTKTDEVIRLAGTSSAFDLREWGVDAEVVAALDVTTQLAFAAGLEALRDAGIPLVRVWKTTANGKRVPQGWMLPEALRDGTGVVFGSAFPGYDQLVRHVENGGRNADGRFDRRFLFQVLAMGHSQFAQLIGARGPNTAVNAACASSTQAIAIAEDWIRVGRCERVIVVGADDVTSEALLPWIGGGFMAAGAASTHDVVEEAALPFDRRRHGLLLGMGAVGVIVETPESCAARGVVPLAEVLAATIVNSAFHGTRLDVDHIASVVRSLVADVAADQGTTPAEMAKHTFFMSHETYTPARGGSAQAEIDALRAAFGESARQVVVSNTKGFTGHAMGAGIEDGVVLKALQYGRVPPVANLKERDEQLGDLTLSSGQSGDYRYALRLAAGFGSQLAVTLHGAIAKGDARLADRDRRLAWLRETTGFANPEERVEDRVLRVVEGATARVHDFSRAPVAAAPVASPPAPPPPAKTTPAPSGRRSGASVPPPPPPRRDRPDEQRGLLATPALPPPRESVRPARAAPAPLVFGVTFEAVLGHLVSVVAEKTGYDPSEIEPDFELEADLGVDTVKQAEILSDVLDHHGLQRDEGFRLSDHATLKALATWLHEQLVRSDAPTLSAVPSRVVDPVAVPEPTIPGRATPAPAPSRRSEPPPAPVAPPPAPAHAVRLDHASALAEIVALVAEKTGYGADELEPGFELEADLGIDTVKQAEILSELQERHGIERDESFNLADYATLDKLAGWLSSRLGGASAPPARPAPHFAPPVDEEEEDSIEVDGLSIDSEPFLSDERRIASLHPADQSYEQTLAVLLGIVAEKTGYDLGDLDPGFELEADLGVDTVKQAEIVGELQDRFGLPSDSGLSLAEVRTLEAIARHLHGRLAQVSIMPAAPSRPAPVESPPSAPVAPALRPTMEVADEPRLPTDEQPIVANHVALPLGFRLRRPTLRANEGEPGTPLAGRRVLVLGDGTVGERLREELGARGAVVVVDAAPELVIDVADDVATSFGRARALDGARPSGWCTLTRLGGFGDGDPSVGRAFADGARAGFTKSLGREWEIGAVVLDVHPSHGPTAVARIVCDEVECLPQREVFVGEDEGRSVVVLVEEAPPEPRTLSGVVLLTGGGRGITATVAHELTRRGRMKLALVGRSPVGREPLDEKAAKERIRADLQARGERVTPARVESVLEPMRRAEDVRQNLEALRRTGAEVVYLTGDLSDPDEARRLVQETTALLGPITHVVHGAGVEESRKIGDKDTSAFHRVFDGKAVGGRALLESVPASAFFVSMGSVAGRFGNPGQVDYAAANDALARMCLARPHSLHMDWTAWDDVGMAVRGGMKALLGDRGVDLLPANAGASVLVDLMAAGVDGELVCAGRLGDFEGRPAHPLLDVLEVDGQVVRATRSLSRRSDPWLLDHAIDGVPVLPGVVGLELMVATAAPLFPGQRFSGARNVRFNAPVKVYRDEVTTLQLEAEPGRPGEALVRLVSVRSLKTGRTRRTEHFSATVIFGEAPEVDGLPSAFLPDETVDQAGIYARFFHGPIFRVLESVLGVSADGLMAEGVVDDRRIAPGLTTLPLVLEACFQAAGLHRMMVSHAMGLPLEVEELSLATAPSADGFQGRISLMVRCDGDAWDIDADGLSGPLMRVRGFRMVEKGPVPPDQRFPEPDGGRPSCFPPPQRSRASSPSGSSTALADADEDPSPWLSEVELAELRARGSERRVRDRVAGRIAAKRALAELCGVDARFVRVETAPSGEPTVRVPGFPTARVSISHREGHAVAVAVLDGRIGVDLERVETRPTSFAATWLTDDERLACTGDPERETVVWAVKEAVLKWFGTGLRASPHEVGVSFGADGAASVRLGGGLVALHGELGGSPLRVAWARHGVDEVLVTVRSAA